MFKDYKVHFARPTAPLRFGRSERDVNVERLRRFVAEAGMPGDLDSVAPSSGFGIVEIRCTERLAERLKDMSEVETIVEA